MTPPAPPFRVALSADFYDDLGKLKYHDIGLELFENIPAIEVARCAKHQAEVAPEQMVGVNGMIVLLPRVTARSLSAADDLLALGRFGVGFDSVDVAACTEAAVLLYITAGAVDWSVAEATVGWMLALTHRVRLKDRLVRDGQWGQRSQHMGCELRDRTLGVVGFGGIGRAVVQLLSGFRMRTPLVFDPMIPNDRVVLAGARKVSLDELLAQSDFVSLHCPLNESTRGLLGARELGLMKRSAYLINTARGGIVEEEALFASLAEGRLAGAALDCFVGEPLTAPPRFAQLDNVLLAPHCIAWTDELFREIGQSACQGMIDLTQRRQPRGIVNPEVLERTAFQNKWRRLCP